MPPLSAPGNLPDVPRNIKRAETKNIFQITIDTDKYNWYNVNRRRGGAIWQPSRKRKTRLTRLYGGL